MKTQNIASLFIDKCKTIEVVFETGNGERTYTYKTVEDLEVDDLVIVKVHGKYKITKVAVVHKVPQIDLNSDINYQWIVQKLDTSRYDEMNRKEAEFRDQMLVIEQKSIVDNAKNLLKDALGVDLMALEDSIKKLNNF